MTSSSIRSALCLLGAVGLITPGCGSGKEVSATPRSRPLVSAEEIIERSLMITDPSVVDSRAASSHLDDPSSTGLGVFSFAHMMQSLAGSQNASAFAETFLTQLATRQVVNGFVTEPTLSAVRSAPENNEPLTALNRWCRTSDGQLDLSRAPFRLIAIVNRPDLRSSSEDVGELRFIYSLLLTDDACQTSQSPGVLPVVQSGTGVAVIFEFAQPAASCSAAHALAGQWQALADLGFGAGYNAALQTLTEGVLGLRTSGRPNGSQLNHVRVNSGKSPSESPTTGLRAPVRTSSARSRAPAGSDMAPSRTTRFSPSPMARRAPTASSETPAGAS